MIPDSIRATKNPWKLPSVWIPLKTITVKPAAGPETLSCQPLSQDTTKPPTMPETSPANIGAPDAKAIPKHSGKATKNITKPAGRSLFMCLR